MCEDAAATPARTSMSRRRVLQDAVALTAFAGLAASPGARRQPPCPRRRRTRRASTPTRWPCTCTPPPRRAPGASARTWPRRPPPASTSPGSPSTTGAGAGCCTGRLLLRHGLSTAAPGQVRPSHAGVGRRRQRGQLVASPVTRTTRRRGPARSGPADGNGRRAGPRATGSTSTPPGNYRPDHRPGGLDRRPPEAAGPDSWGEVACPALAPPWRR